MFRFIAKSVRKVAVADIPEAGDVSKRDGTAPGASAGAQLSAFASAMGSLRGERAQSSQTSGGGPSRERGPAARIAEQLRESCAGDVVFLHHRRTPRAKPHIDHLVVCPSGVWIVHSRSNQGRVATRKPMFGDPKLTIGGRERTDLLQSLERQVGYVAAALAKSHPLVEIRSALCFVDTEAPLLRTLYLGSYLFFGSQALAKHLGSEGPCDAGAISAVAYALEESFPPA